LKTYIDGATHDNLRFKVIGPAGSTTLLEMIKELKKNQNSDKDRSSDGFQIYSATATVSNSSLLKAAEIGTEEPQDLEPSKKIQALFDNLDIEFRRTISSDQELSDLLIEELDRRPEAVPSFFGKHQDDHLVLIAEWDTFYGRSLPEIFLNAIRRKHNLNSDDKVDWVHRFIYLRGIDGILTGEKGQTNREGSDQGSNRQGKANLPSLEEPWGRSQYDYLRRLADSIYLLDQRKRKNKKGAIKAIGVLGSDFYDKFLVLQALKQRFPQAIFFTTDLDARLLHDNYIEWTRNLVVASAFDLELPKDLQGDVPPFRSSYQTSAFYATLQAFCDQEQASAQEPTKVCKDFKQKFVRHPAKPLIFEIGQKSAVNLMEEDNLSDLRDILRILFFILLILLLLFLLSRSVRNWLKSVRPTYLIVIGTLLILILFNLIYFFEFNFAIPCDEEPVLWTEGVSVWPTEFLRLIALVFTWIFFAIGIKSLRESDLELEKEFHFGDGKEGNQSPKQHQENQQIKPQRWRHNPFLNWEVKNQEDGIHINKLWEEYLQRGSLTNQILFILCVLIVYVPVPMSLVCFFDWPICPVRGDLSRRLDPIILILTIPSFRHRRGKIHAKGGRANSMVFPVLPFERNALGAAKVSLLGRHVLVLLH
jgi:hypothetical protein